MAVKTHGSAAVVGRFAPSPTGPLHLGSLVAAVGSYLFARSVGGKWLMRVEDLDTPRVIEGMADDILRTLEALGLTWDGPIVYQSKRTKAYAEAMDKLLAQGVAYPCGCTRKEVALAATAPHAGEEGPVYPGTCRGGLPEGREPRSHRLCVEGEEVEFVDLVRGKCKYDLTALGGDFVIRRADGIFAYQLAVVVDDGEAGVNQVVRGADLITSTPRQIILQKLLGLPTPAYAHLPLVTAPDGGKLSKRDNPVTISSAKSLEREGGELVGAALGFLGFPPPRELLKESGEEVLHWGVENFDPARVSKLDRPLEFE